MLGAGGYRMAQRCCPSGSRGAEGLQPGTPNPEGRIPLNDGHGTSGTLFFDTRTGTTRRVEDGPGASGHCLLIHGRGRPVVLKTAPVLQDIVF